MESKGLISVIIPVYNVEKYLAQCLDSMVRQTYGDLEIICVNDGSTDGSRNILSKYAEIDNRIKIVDKTNSGQSSARNLGLQNIHGDYVMFVDADDWIDLDTCEKAISTAQSNDADVVMWGYYSEHKKHSDLKLVFTSNKVFEGDSVHTCIHRRFAGLIGDELQHPEYLDSLSTVWGKLYRSSVLMNGKVAFIDLHEIGTCEDALYNLEVFGNVNKVVYFAEGLYHYRKNVGISTTSSYRIYLAEQWKNLFRHMDDYIDSHNVPIVFTQALQNRIAISVLGLTLNICNANNESFCSKISILRNIVNSDPYRQALMQLDVSCMPVHWKLFFSCAKYQHIVVLMSLGMIIHLMLKHR